MDEEIYTEWMGLIKPIFPDQSEVRSFKRSDDLVISVNWKLDNDISRPNKRSRRIEIVVSEEALEDYREKSIKKRFTDNEKLKSFVQQQYRQFNPEPGTSRYELTPVEKWVVTLDVLSN